MERKMFWTEYMRSYDRIYANLKPYQEMMSLATDAFHDCKKVLDSSAGTGYLTEKLLKEGKGVTALDNNEDALKVLQSKIGPSLKELSVVMGDGQSLPFASKTFDGVASIRAMEFMENPHQYLAEQSRVLIPAGTLVVGGPSPEAQDFEYVGGRWQKELRQIANYEEFMNDWDIVFRNIHNMITTKKVKHWLSAYEVASMLEREIGMQVTKSVPNPLYYGRGYFIVAKK